MDNTINVVLATDERYLKQSFIVMESVMVNAQLRDVYCFFILTNREVIDKYSQYIEYFEKKYNTCKVVYMLVDSMIGEASISMRHITRATYYRLLIPRLLNVDKCIYLDSDVIVVDDIRKLYEISINNYEVAGVKAPTYHMLGKNEENYKRESGLVEMKQYINAGVLLLNLKELRKNGFVEKALELLKMSLPGQDQDIINRLCYGKIKHIPFKYNFQPARLSLVGLEKVFAYHELEEAMNEPVIIHYLTAEKPWECLDIAYADRWWQICRKSMFDNLFYKEYKNEFVYYGIVKHMPLWREKIFSESWFEAISKFNNIYVYGAGRIGRELVRELQRRGIWIQKILVSEMTDGMSEFVEGIQVEEFSDNVNDTALIIIATSQQYQLEIRRNLLKKNKFMIIQCTTVNSV